MNTILLCLVTLQLRLRGDRITNEGMRKRSRLLMPQICCYNNNIEHESTRVFRTNLISSCIVAEKNNDLLMKNRQSCPTSDVAIPKKMLLQVTRVVTNHMILVIAATEVELITNIIVVIVRMHQTIGNEVVKKEIMIGTKIKKSSVTVVE